MQRALVLTALFGAACVQSSALSVPDVPGMEAGALFEISGEQPELIPFDPGSAHWIGDTPETRAELWLWSCPADVVRVPPAAALLAPLSPPAQPGECASRGAPCPARAYSFDPEAAEPWQELSQVAAQPWPYERTEVCLSFGAPLPVEIDDLGPSGEPSFGLAMDADLVLLGARVVPGLFGVPTSGVLQVWRLGPDPVREGPTRVGAIETSTVWMAGLALQDGQVYVLGEGGRTARLSMGADDTPLLVPDRPYPADQAYCMTDLGIEPARKGGVAGGLTAAGLELWVVNECGAILKRVGDGDWQLMRPRDVVRHKGRGGVLWLGPGEALVAGLESGAVIHITGDEVRNEVLPRPLPSETIGWSPDGLPMVPLFDETAGALFERSPRGVWAQKGELYSENTAVFVSALGSIMLGGTSMGRVLQLRDGKRCPLDHTATFASGALFRALFVSQDHLVAVLHPNRPEPGGPTAILGIVDPIDVFHCDRLP